MITLRREQLEAFEQVAARHFEDEMVSHSQDFAPRLSKVLGEAQLRVVVRRVLARAATYGFTHRGPARLYLELTFLLGSGFDTDPQYPDLRRVLTAPDDQMERARRIHEGVRVYQEQVAGLDNINVRSALEAMLAFSSAPVVFSAEHLEHEMLREMERMFPQKAAYVGENGLKALIREGRAVAGEYGIPTLRGEVLIVSLMFAFGHGCTEDPLYPWIAGTLNNVRIISPAALAGRLESKAVTWLEHVLARPRKGEHT